MVGCALVTALVVMVVIRTPGGFDDTTRQKDGEAHRAGHADKVLGVEHRSVLLVAGEAFRWAAKNETQRARFIRIVIGVRF